MNQRRPLITTLIAAALTATTAVGIAHAGSYGQRDPGVAIGYTKTHYGDRHDWRGERGLRGLNLTQEQRDQIFEITYAQQPALRDLRKQLRAGRQALGEAATAKVFDKEKVQALADEQAKREAQMIVMRTETRNKIYQLLTDEQREQLTQRPARRGPRL